MQNYSKNSLQDYSKALARVASLSGLFSESKTPFIQYRVPEYLYSKIMQAENLSRSDIAFDARLGRTGVGIKTFVYSKNAKFEKIAEFNKNLTAYNNLSGRELAVKIAELRNERIGFAGRLTNTDNFIYHCVARMPEKLVVFETEMQLIDIDSIKVTKDSSVSIDFNDGRGIYRFSKSKSTLYKSFEIENAIFEQSIKIHSDPFELLGNLGLVVKDPSFLELSEIVANDSAWDSVILPLYSLIDGKKIVHESSGLNQWNAQGRTRHPDEVYIQHPANIRRLFPGFFPPRDTHFDLKFPNGMVLEAKICQADGKALMSKSNRELGKWILRDVLRLKEGTVVTYADLEKIGIDAVELSKLSNKVYSISFKSIGSYETFLDKFS